jgi:hypothetical protein
VVSDRELHKHSLMLNFNRLQKRVILSLEHKWAGNFDTAYNPTRIGYEISIFEFTLNGSPVGDPPDTFFFFFNIVLKEKGLNKKKKKTGGI